MNKSNLQFITKKSEQLRRILEELQTKHYDLQTYFEIASDKWQQSSKGELMSKNLSALVDVINELKTVLTSLEAISEYK